MKKALALFLVFLVTAMLIPFQVFSDDPSQSVFQTSADFSATQNIAAGWSYAFAAPDSHDYTPFNHFYSFAGSDWWSQDTDNNWDYGRIGKWKISPSSSRDTAYAYTFFRDGTVDISADENSIAYHPDKFGALATNIAIYKNNVRIWPLDKEWGKIEPKTNAGDLLQEYTFPYLVLSGRAGDKIHFRINSGDVWDAADSLRWSPTVTYTDLTYVQDDDPETTVTYEYTKGFTDQQWKNSWGYLYAGIGDDLALPQRGQYDAAWSADSGNYMTGLIAQNFVLPCVENDVIIAFKAPVSGTVSISMAGGKISLSDSSSSADAGDGAAIGIFKSSAGEISNIWPANGLNPLANGEELGFSDLTISVRKNEYIWFRANHGAGQNWHDTITMLPIITYQTKNTADPGVQEGGSGERILRPAGADTASLPLDVVESTQIKTAAEMLLLIKSNTASGVYQLSENLVLNSDFDGTTIDGAGVTLVFVDGAKLQVTSQNTILKNLIVNEAAEIVLLGKNNVLLNTIAGKITDKTTDGAWV